MPQEPAIIVSDSYNLTEFHKNFEFPQMVRVTHGNLGVIEENTISAGQELIFFFVKTSTVVVATSEKTPEFYHIPLNSCLQFAPYQYKSPESIHYETIDDVLKGSKKHGLPKAMRVRKSYKGKSDESSVIAGELIFPKKVSSRMFGKSILECFNSDKKMLKLELSCAGDFSIDPNDVKMYLLELTNCIKDFPLLVKVFNDNVNTKLSYINSGMTFTLEEPGPLQSYICTADLFGKNDYPLMELPVSLPIRVQRIQYPGFNMGAILTKTQHTYENFTPSLVKRSVFAIENHYELATQQQLYEAVQNGTSSQIYTLKKPNIIYDHKADTTDNPYSLPSESPYDYPAGCSPSLEFTVKPFFTSIHRDKQGTWPRCHPRETPRPPLPRTPPPSRRKSLSSEPAPLTSPDENRTYLRSLNVNDVLRLLDKMNLGQYKGTFQKKKIDGKAMLSYTTSDLEELGVSNTVQQKRLIEVITGKASYRLK